MLVRSLVGKIPWRRKWQPTPVFLPGESQGRGSLVGCLLWDRMTRFRIWAGLSHRTLWKCDPRYRATKGFPDSSVVKESACNTGYPGSIPGSGRSPGERKGYPLRYSGLENSMDSPWGHKESTRLSDFHFPTRRDSRGERSPWLPLETRPDSPGEPGMQPRTLTVIGEVGCRGLWEAV